MTFLVELEGSNVVRRVKRMYNLDFNGSVTIEYLITTKFDQSFRFEPTEAILNQSNQPSELTSET